MSFRAHRFICLIVFVLLLSCAGFAATPVTYLYLNSQPRDFIGQGQTLTFTPADGVFATSTSSNAVSASFHNSDYSQSWTLDFATPTSTRFAKGQYIGAQRTLVGSPTRPGVDVFGDGRGCDQVGGQFLVSDFALAPDGTVARLAIDFEQHCESFPPALYGSIRYNSSVSQVPRLGIGAVSTLKGNAGTSNAVATVALSSPSANPVTVQYLTTDNTALQNVDYQATTGTLTFPPGSTSQTIVVPILGDRLARGNKQFKLSLKTPTAALLGAASAMVLIRDPNVTMNALAMNFQSSDGTPVGQRYLITPSDGIFTTYTSANFVDIMVHNGDGWTLVFGGPSTTRILAGDYPNATGGPAPPGTPTIDVFGGPGYACNTLTGSFDVLKAGYSSPGVLQTFSADFAQRCDGSTTTLFGSVRFRSLLQQFSVTNAVITGPSAVFTVTLNPALANSVTVTFSTGDGTALAGSDYASTTTSLAFSPGMTEQTVSVPLLSSGNAPQKTFFGHLSSPSSAAVWISQGSAAF